MSKKYKVEWVERKRTTTGKEMLKVTLKDETDAVTDNVAIWEGFPNFIDLKAGDDVEGDLVSKQNGQYENKTLYAPKVASTGFVGRSGGMSMMKEKAKNIEEAQQRKSDSIAFFNSTNSAISLVSKLNIENMSESEIKVKIVAYREWFLKEYENWNNQPF